MPRLKPPMPAPMMMAFVVGVVFIVGEWVGGGKRVNKEERGK
jgi:hypothetical protein